MRTFQALNWGKPGPTFKMDHNCLQGDDEKAQAWPGRVNRARFRLLRAITKQGEVGISGKSQEEFMRCRSGELEQVRD